VLRVLRSSSFPIIDDAAVVVTIFFRYLLLPLLIFCATLRRCVCVCGLWRSAAVVQTEQAASNDTPSLWISLDEPVHYLDHTPFVDLHLLFIMLSLRVAFVTSRCATLSLALVRLLSSCAHNISSLRFRGVVGLFLFRLAWLMFSFDHASHIRLLNRTHVRTQPTHVRAHTHTLTHTQYTHFPSLSLTRNKTSNLTPATENQKLLGVIRRSDMAKVLDAKRWPPKVTDPSSL
jgi:hypothetical protein